MTLKLHFRNILSIYFGRSWQHADELKCYSGSMMAVGTWESYIPETK